MRILFIGGVCTNISFSAEESFEKTLSEMGKNAGSFFSDVGNFFSGFSESVHELVLDTLYTEEGLFVTDAPSNFLITPLHTAGLKIHYLVQQSPQNSVHCPLGIVQTLALLDTISSSPVRQEIASFLSCSKITQNMKGLNRSIISHCLSLSNDQSGWERRNNASFVFVNNSYAFMSTQLRLSNSCDADIDDLGGKRINLDFSNHAKAATAINKIVAQDTHDKILDLLSADSFKERPAVVLLHTLYLKADWLFKAKEGHFIFTNLEQRKKYVKSFVIEAEYLKFYQQGKVSYVAIPTVGDCHLIVRHSETLGDLQPITQEQMERVLRMKPSYVKELQAPCVSMVIEHDLGQILGDLMPTVLKKEFDIQIHNHPIKVNKYIQKVTFDMTEEGIEASSATSMITFELKCASLVPDGPRFIFNSPFTFVLSQKIEGVGDYPVFHGEVMSEDVMRRG